MQWVLDIIVPPPQSLPSWGDVLPSHGDAELGLGNVKRNIGIYCGNMAKSIAIFRSTVSPLMGEHKVRAYSVPILCYLLEACSCYSLVAIIVMMPQNVNWHVGLCVNFNHVFVCLCPYVYMCYVFKYVYHTNTFHWRACSTLKRPFEWYCHFSSIFTSSAKFLVLQSLQF